MAGRERGRLLIAGLAGTVGLISMLFFPFAGFTERTAYVPSPIFRDYGLAGVGTYGQEFNPFGYPAGVGIVQILMLLLAAALVIPLIRSLRWHRSAESPAPAEVRPIARLVAGIGAGAVLLVVVALVAVFPSVEEQTIWVTESAGWLEDWWPAYGAFVTPIAVGVMAAVLGLMVRDVAAAEPPAKPPPAQPEPPPAE